MYEGWTSGPNFGTGEWRITTHSGRKFFVDPLGNLFFGLGF